jgi:hypothetical protein
MQPLLDGEHEWWSRLREIDQVWRRWLRRVARTGRRASGALVAASVVFAACRGAGSVPPRDNSGITEGQAFVKFCHLFTRNGADLALTMEFGQPPLARLTAHSGLCSTPVGEPCIGVPVGNVPVQLLDGDSVLLSGLATLRDGTALLFVPVATSGGVALRSRFLESADACRADPTASDGGTRDSTATDGGTADAAPPDDSPADSAETDASLD